jgi:phosphate transport system substrate-binding protein
MKQILKRTFFKAGIAFIKVGLAIGLFLINSTAVFAAKNSITVAGSTTVLPIVQPAAEAFMDIHNNAKVSIRGGGSGVGIASLISGSIDIATSSRVIQTKELQTARLKGKNPVGTVIALDGLAIIVNSNNPINELNIKTLKDIYMGKISNWKALGGPNQPIVIISRDVASGTFEVFKEKVMGGDKAREDALMLASNGAVASTVGQTQGAIGYVGIGFLSEKNVKPLTIEGVLPSIKTVKSNEYKLSRPLYVYTNGNPKGLAKNYIDFILSSAGQKIVAETGFVPLN